MNQHTIKFLEDTSLIYKKIAEYMLLIEQVSPERSVPLPTINEFRAVLHHLYKAQITPENEEAELHKASEHLYRAFYDAYSILCSCIIEKVESVFENFTIEDITKVFGEYFELHAQIEAVKEIVTDVRTRRDTDLHAVGGFEGRWAEVNLLLKNHKTIVSKIPLMQKAKSERLGKEESQRIEKKGEDVRKKQLIYLEKSLYVVGGIIIAVIAFFFTQPFKSASSKPTEKQSVIDSTTTTEKDTAK